MANGITYPKALRDRAAAEKRDLFACGMDGAGCRMTAHCSMPRGEAGKLMLFCVRVTKGDSPEEAFKKAYGQKG